MLEILLGLAVLVFAALFPSTTAFIILGIVIVVCIPDARRILREHRRR